MFRYLWRVLRARILRDVLKEVDRLSDTDLDEARRGAERAIQRRRWIPGELRRWLCAARPPAARSHATLSQIDCIRPPSTAMDWPLM